jgi:hypothetical protein
MQFLYSTLTLLVILIMHVLKVEHIPNIQAYLGYYVTLSNYGPLPQADLAKFIFTVPLMDVANQNAPFPPPPPQICGRDCQYKCTTACITSPRTACAR